MYIPLSDEDNFLNITLACTKAELLDLTFVKDLGTDHLISRGGGWDFSSRQVIFFSLLAQQVIFSRSKPQQVFYFFEEITH